MSQQYKIQQKKPQIWVGENTLESQSDSQQVDELNENEITRIKNL